MDRVVSIFKKLRIIYIMLTSRFTVGFHFPFEALNLSPLLSPLTPAILSAPRFRALLGSPIPRRRVQSDHLYPGRTRIRHPQLGRSRK